MKNILPPHFSNISIIKAIHKATYYDYESSQSEKDNLEFLELIDRDYIHLASKRFFQKAFVFSLCKAVKLRRLSTLTYLKTSKLFNQLPKSKKVEFLSYALSFKHENYKLILDLLKSDPELPNNRKIKKTLEMVKTSSFN
ncbi:MAG: hypothetical protein S4CHLAM6_03560 [Chlamydiae bacterium]|nr:hypothetical protein [Chlamydiota bacterium]